MPLISIWTSNPQAVLALSIEQIVSTAGDGKLKDGSECSSELREFLSQVQSEKLAEYADYCLSTAFVKSGGVLQDIVNELGRRLEYKVTNGRYQGTANAVGNDGLWKSPEGRDILVEVKTTDAYRIPLDTIAKYRDQLLRNEQISEINSMLLVVGREDTGEVEAQVRGSRHAWDMRLISVDSLVRLVNIKESVEGELTGSKIRSLLVPMEYTRLDALIDVMFTTARDVETAVDAEKQDEAEGQENNTNWSFTAPELLQEKRTLIINALARQHNVRLIRKSRALYWSSDHNFRAVCTVSKRYEKPGALPYWYAFHPQWDEFLSEANESFFVLGCMDLDIAFSIPLEILKTHLDELNTTTKPDGTMYWHVKIIENKPGIYVLQMPKSGKHISLTDYLLKLS
nr:hypothetical protein [Nitrosomonas nitrosa]